jgi:NAD(P)-dependent dehydrogenase (short-subunit alcohol dehydrogenase family)
MSLAGRTAAVTGASGAIGSAISKALNELGGQCQTKFYAACLRAGTR